MLNPLEKFLRNRRGKKRETISSNITADASKKYSYGILVLLWPFIPCLMLSLWNPWPEIDFRNYWLIIFTPYVIFVAIFSSMKETAIRRTPTVVKGTLDKTTMANTNVHGFVAIGKDPQKPVSSSNPESFMRSPGQIHCPGGIKEFGVPPSIEDIPTITPQGTFIRWRHLFFQNGHFTRYPVHKLPKHFRRPMQDAFPQLRDYHFVDVATEPIFIIMNPKATKVVLDKMDDAWNTKNDIKDNIIPEFTQYHSKLLNFLLGRDDGEQAFKNLFDGFGNRFDGIIANTNIGLDIIGEDMVDVQSQVRNVQASTPYYDTSHIIQDQEAELEHEKEKYSRLWHKYIAETKPSEEEASKPYEETT